MEKHQIEYNNKTIVFFVERKNVKNVNVNIKPDMSVVISANEHVPMEFIEKLIHRRASWILKHVNAFEKVQPERKSEREYVSGESLKYLGKQYRLRVIKVDHVKQEGVKYFRGYLHVYVKDAEDKVRKKNLIEQWMRKRASIIFQEQLAKAYGKVVKYGVDQPEISVRVMKSRWGSALVDQKTIQLNFELIKAPKACIEYVVLHELIHFIHNNHSEAFYTLLDVLMPDWEDRKRILDEETVKEI
ncbi:M48 family metallopeptidase [Salisediminibacterium beveridgei]|uniref:Putative metal-dependent hydrolase n=1 Tax=Salisediminibacterium beveridgei TaxID=632773 RepID=A0A1D7QSS6_9BACI|nr:SprT family zinc-dependent metalloprotease [Salisediminibacterium beveridgei]AOM82070.1 putative metal-dependent hydrolase [Salisediminibacterium beveridgei]